MSRAYARAALEAEAALLGLLLRDPMRWAECDVTPEHFDDTDHQRLYRAIGEASIGGTAELATIVPRFVAQAPRTATPTAFCVELMDRAGFDAAALCHTLRDARWRDGLRVAALALAEQTDRTAEGIEAALSGVMDAATATATAGQRATTAAMIATECLHALDNPSTTPLPVRTGYAALDDILLGLPRGEEVVLAARPGMGKSALADLIALHVAQRGAGVFVASLEMPKRQVLTRLLAATTGLDARSITSGRLTDAERAAVGRAAAHMPTTLHVYDALGATAARVVAEARRVQSIQPLDLLVVDYLQLLGDRPDRGETRATLVGRQNRALLEFARSVGAALLVLSQLNREVEHRTSKRPTLADLRESGEIEQDAAVVGFLYRQGYYDPAHPAAETELILAKNRSGPVGTRYLHFALECCAFFDRTTTEAAA